MTGPGGEREGPAGEIKIRLPSDIADMLTPEIVKRVAVGYLLRHGKISDGKAADILGVRRRDILDLMRDQRILSAPLSVEELKEERKIIRKYATP